MPDLARELRELAAASARMTTCRFSRSRLPGGTSGLRAPRKPTAAKSRPAGGDLLDATMPRPHTSVRAARARRVRSTKYEVRSTEWGKNHRREPEPEVAQGRSRGVCMKCNRRSPTGYSVLRTRRCAGIALFLPAPKGPDPTALGSPGKTVRWIMLQGPTGRHSWGVAMPPVQLRPLGLALYAIRPRPSLRRFACPVSRQTDWLLRHLPS